MNTSSLNSGYCVLLCSYNGSAFLAEQLDSIAQQDLAPACVFFFDDGSSDDSLAIARRYIDVLPITFVNPVKRRTGAAGAFEAILHHAAEASNRFAAYILCDQDDIWETGKARQLMAVLNRLPADLPALVHSELKCFGEATAGRKLLHQSLGHSRNDSIPTRPLQSLLFENVVVGASTGFNRTLLECAVPMPLAAFMHDWWLAITCVAYGGEIVYISDALTRYRIHANSTVGRAGNFMHALPRRLRALAVSARDPWLKTIGEQLEGIAGDPRALPATYFEPFLSAGRAIFEEPRFRLRCFAWLLLCKQRIWSMPSKDIYYKARLFTDYVIIKKSA